MIMYFTCSKNTYSLIICLFLYKFDFLANRMLNFIFITVTDFFDHSVAKLCEFNKMKHIYEEILTH